MLSHPERTTLAWDDGRILNYKVAPASATSYYPDIEYAKINKLIWDPTTHSTNSIGFYTNKVNTILTQDPNS